MTETVTETPARNYVGGEWRESANGETYEKRNPWRPSHVTGVYPASDAEAARTAIAAARDAFPAWSALPGPARAAFFTGAAAADRGTRRADRTRHDRRDGQAASRGPDGDASRRDHHPARGGRGLPAGRRDVRAVGSEPAALHAPASARCRRPHHPGTSRSRSPCGSWHPRSSTATRSFSSSATRRLEPGSTSRSALPRRACRPAC